MDDTFRDVQKVGKRIRNAWIIYHFTWYGTKTNPFLAISDLLVPISTLFIKKLDHTEALFLIWAISLFKSKDLRLGAKNSVKGFAEERFTHMPL